MKNLLKILAGGLAVFLAMGIAQEWEVFSSAWFPDAGRPQPEQENPDVEAAAATVREALTLMAHLYGSRGDLRFAERMPVGEEILEEIERDIDYLARNGRVQDPRLQKFELLGGEPLGDDRIDLRTREFWIHRLFWADGSGESDPPRSTILNCRYSLVRGPRGWLVFAWELEAGGPPP